MRTSSAVRFAEPVDVLEHRRLDAVRELRLVQKLTLRHSADNPYDDQMRRIFAIDVVALRRRIGFLDGVLLGIY